MTTHLVEIRNKNSWQQPVEDKDLTAPPAEPSKGDRYIVGASATGDWSGHDGDITYYDGSDWQFITKAEGQVVYVKDEDRVYAYTTAWGEQRYIEFNFPAGCWNYPTTNPAPLDRDTGGNGGMFRHLFDDTTEEFILLEPAFEIPDNLDTAGTVYFSLFGYAKTADGNEVQFRISLSARAKGESWDNAYGTKDSGDYATDAQQDELDEIEWSETVANLGLAAKDLLRLMVSRIAIVDGTKVTGDYDFLNLKIRIPVT